MVRKHLLELLALFGFSYSLLVVCLGAIQGACYMVDTTDGTGNSSPHPLRVHCQVWLPWVPFLSTR